MVCFINTIILLTLYAYRYEANEVAYLKRNTLLSYQEWLYYDCLCLLTPDAAGVKYACYHADDFILKL